MDKVYLAPCPFCEGLAKKEAYDPYDGYQGNNTVYSVRCRKCGAVVNANSFDEAVKKWNERAMTARELFNSYRRICEEYSRKGKIRCYDECPLYSVCPEIGKALRAVNIWAYVIERWTQEHPEERSE